MSLAEQTSAVEWLKIGLAIQPSISACDKKWETRTIVNDVKCFAVLVRAVHDKKNVFFLGGRAWPPIGHIYLLVREYGTGVGIPSPLSVKIWGPVPLGPTPRTAPECWPFELFTLLHLSCQTNDALLSVCKHTGFCISVLKKSQLSCYEIHFTDNKTLWSFNRQCDYSATSNNMKLVHWPLMGGLLLCGTTDGDLFPILK